MATFTRVRISSLLGVVPLGWLWVSHLWVGSAVLGGVDALDARVAHAIALWPHRTYLIAADILFLWLPLVYHAAIGLSRFGEGRDTVRAYPTLRNWAYSAQRWTGIILVPFLAYHMLNTWWLINVTWGGQVAGPDPAHPEQIITFGTFLVLLFAGGFVAKVAYACGLFAAAFHLSQGLWSFGVNWGLVSGQRAMKGWSVACTIVFAIVFVMSMNILAELVRIGAAV